ncbi:hypothetical protein GZH47_23645 [Paenibacillus rhizovicinus]|uniref:PpiC domain-containing protein n=1 Tax=Paenibacillus rhizovicinus TaxID=2704463 RepID=A0A6C0P4X3_9BACL|nr:peptidyl-prolyl cis-trans isomerase [Paenibacillus rhizovicinus]QHW33495.1 hypothetical protein GZH47_23645 [Paenibacillus rhizovicinus]
MKKQALRPNSANATAKTKANKAGRNAEKASRREAARQPHRKRRIYIWPGVAAVLLALILGLVAWRSPGGSPNPSDVIARVDGEPVSYGEFAHELTANRAVVIGYFKDKYGTEFSPDFWTTAVGGELPLDRVKRLALDASVRRKVQQIEARKHGLTADISYRTLLRTMKETNADREAKVKRNEVVYGPVTFDEQRFIDDSGQRLFQALRDELQPGFAITDAEISAYYEANKTQFELGDSRTIRAIEVVFADEQDRKQAIGSARSKLNDILAQLDGGAKFADVYDRLSADSASGLSVSERVYDYKTPRTESINHPVLMAAINKLAAGQTSGLVEDGLSIGIYACVDKSGIAAIPLNEAEPQIKKDLASTAYNRFVDELQRKAQVEIDDRNMAKVEMQ